MENSKFEMKLKPGFPLSKVEQIFYTDDYFDARCQLQNASLLISADQLKKRLTNMNLKIVSVIENTEVPIPFRVDLKIPLSRFDPLQLKEISSHEVVIVCHRGISSYTATEQMKRTYPQAMVYSLKDGIDQFELS
jgi:adenylyltransferase/sulfurtransferase